MMAAQAIRAARAPRVLISLLLMLAATGAQAAQQATVQSRNIAVALDGTLRGLDRDSPPDRYLDRMLLNLRRGDTLAIYIPLGKADDTRMLVDTTVHRRPLIRDQQRLAVHNLVAHWQAAAPAPDNATPLADVVLAAANRLGHAYGSGRLIVIGRVASADPPKPDDLRAAGISGIHVTAVDIGTPNQKTDDRDKALAKWATAIKTAGGHWEQLPLVPEAPAKDTPAAKDEKDLEKSKKDKAK